MPKKKLNLNEDDYLVELVQEWKPYLKIAKEMNQSVRLVIDKKNSYLNLLKEATTEKSLIERLLQENEVSWDDYQNLKKDCARKDGLQWAQNAALDTIDSVLQVWRYDIKEALKKSTLAPEPDFVNACRENLMDYFESKIFPLYPTMSWYTEEFNEYILDWLSGITDYINLIEEKFDLSKQEALFYSKIKNGNQTK